MNLFRNKPTKLQKVADELRRRIQNYELPPAVPLATSQELAAEFGVSYLTADRAVRQLVAEGLLTRRKGDGTYVNLPRERYRIGYCDDFEANYLFAKTQAINDSYRLSIHRELEFRNCECIEINYRQLQSEGFCRRIMPELDGLIFSSSVYDDKTSSQVAMCRAPKLLYRIKKIRDLPFIQVVSDFTTALEELFQRIDLKRKKRFCLLSATSPDIRFFAECFIEKAYRHGITDSQIQSNLVDIRKGISPQLAGHKFGRQLKITDDLFIFTTSDLLAFGILDAFDERGLKPGDYQLASCNNWEEHGISPFPEPRLTSIDHRNELCSQRGIELLLQSIKSKDETIPMLRIPARLVVRTSDAAHF